MQDSLTKNGRTFVSTAIGADVTSYSQNYVSELARDGTVDSFKVGRSWFVDKAALLAHAGKVADAERGEKKKGNKNNTDAPQKTAAGAGFISANRLSSRWRKGKSDPQPSSATKKAEAHVPALPAAVLSVALAIIALAGFVTVSPEDQSLALSAQPDRAVAEQQAAVATAAAERQTLLGKSVTAAIDSFGDSLQLTHALGEIILSPLQSMFTDASRFAWTQFRDFGEVIVANPDYSTEPDVVTYWSPETQTRQSNTSTNDGIDDTQTATSTDETQGSTGSTSGEGGTTVVRQQYRTGGTKTFTAEFNTLAGNDARLATAVGKLARLTTSVWERGSAGSGAGEAYVDEEIDDLRDLLYANDESILDAADYDHPDDIDLQELTADSVAATSGTFASITVEDGFSSGATTSVSGEFQTKDDTIIGDEASDDLTVNAGLASDLDPATTSTYSLGSSTNRFLSGYFSDLLSAETVTSSSTETTDLTTENATSTNLFAAIADFVNLVAENSTTTNATTTNGYTQNQTVDNSSTTNSYIENLTADESTTMDGYVENLESENATTTNFFASLANFTEGFFGELTATIANITNLNVENADIENATTTDSYTETARIEGAVIDSSTTTNATTTNSYIQNLQADDVAIENIDTQNATTTNLFVRDDATFGDTVTDELSVNSTIGSDLVPNSNASFNLGSQSFFWDNAYVDNLNANNISAASSSISGTAAEDFTINTDNNTQDGEEMSLIFFRGQVTPNAVLSWDNVSDRFSFNQATEIWNESASTTNPTLSLRGTAGQTANIFQAASSSGTVLAAIRPDGTIVAPTASTTNIQTTDLEADSADIQNLSAASTTFDAVSATSGAFANLQASSTDTGTLTAEESTTTDGYVENLESENASTTNFFASLANFTEGFFDELTATIASITDLDVENADIENATTTDSYTETARIDSATIGESTTTDSFIQDLMTEMSTTTDAFIANLAASSSELTTAEITDLLVENATTTESFIETLVAEDADFASASATTATIENLFAENSTTSNATTTNSYIQNLLAENATTTNSYIQSLTADDSTTTNAFIQNLTAASTTIDSVSATSGEFAELVAEDSTTTNAYAENLTTENATSTNLFATAADFTSAFVENLTATVADFVNLEADNATTTNLVATDAETENLSVAGNATGQEADAPAEFVTLSQITSGSNSTDAFLQDGNSFGTLATLGTNDAQDLGFETSDTERVRIDTDGNVGVGTTDPAAKLTVSDGGILASGVSGGVPVSGSGTRLMWVPSQSAFRAGFVNGSQWDGTNIGDSSLAVGSNTIASGFGSAAFGDSTEASASGATAFGFQTTASELYATAFGQNTTASDSYATVFGINSAATGFASLAAGDSTTASGGQSFASGFNTTASGDVSFAAGANTTASGFNSTAFGADIESGGAYSFAVGLDGNQSGVTVPANTAAFMGGNVGIGTVSPQEELSVQGDGGFTGTVSGAEAGAQDEFVTLSQLSSGADSTDAFLQGGNSFGTLATLGTNDTNDLAIETAGTEQVRIDTDGDVGIGTADPASKLEVDGTTRINSANDGILQLTQEGIAGTGGTADPGWNYIEFYDSERDRQGYFGIDADGNFQFAPQVSGAVTEVESPLSADTLNTGQGANELYAMNQDVETGDSVTFNDVTFGSTNITEANIDALDDGVIDISAETNLVAGNQLTLSGDTLNILEGSGSGLNADTLDGLNNTQFLRSDTSDTMDAGTNTNLDILSNDSGESTLSLLGDGQGTGRLYVGQSTTHGGGIEYNGDGSPGTTGAGSDYVTLFRRSNSTDEWTARNRFNSNDWEFRANVSASTLNTGQGNNELYAMNQPVRTTDDVDFDSVAASQFMNIGGADRSSSYLSGDADLAMNNWMYTDAILHTGENGGSPAGLVFGNGNTIGDDQISLVTSGNTQMYVDTDGEIGVGTTNPQNQLDVQGGIDAGTLNTGLGDNELYAMNQNVETNDNVNFNSVTSEYIDLANNEMTTYDTDGRLYWDLSEGVYIKSSNADHNTGPALLWSSANFDAGNQLSVSYDGADNPTLSVNENNLDADTLDGLNSSQFLRSDTGDTKTGNTEFDDDIFANFGMTGGYGNTTGSGGDWGANIWSIGDSWSGTRAGSGFTLDSSGQYGLSWLRSGHPSANSFSDEGLYLYRAGTNFASLGNGGARFNTDIDASGRITADEMIAPSGYLLEDDSGNGAQRYGLKNFDGVVQLHPRGSSWNITGIALEIEQDRLSIDPENGNNAVISQSRAMNCELAANSNGDIICSGTSDRNLKTDIDSLDSGSSLSQINELDGKTFRYRPEAQLGDSQEIGFIAQDVEQIFPELVGESNGYKYVRYDKLTAVLAEAIQEVDQKVTELEEESNEASFWSDDVNMTDKKNREPSDGLIAAVGAVLEDFAGNIRARFKEVWAERVVAEDTLEAGEKICIDGECITKNQLRDLVDLANGDGGEKTSKENETSGGRDAMQPREESQPDQESDPSKNTTEDEVGAADDTTEEGGSSEESTQEDADDTQQESASTSTDEAVNESEPETETESQRDSSTTTDNTDDEIKTADEDTETQVEDTTAASSSTEGN